MLNPRLLVAAAVLVSSVACSAPATAVDDVTARQSTAAGSTSGPVDEVTFAVVGDSLTAGDRPVVDGQGPGAGSWVPAADVPPLVLAGGWAVSGSTSADMRAAVSPVDADVVVVLAGTNDLTNGVPPEQTFANVVAIVDEVGIDTVLLVAVPPKDSQPQEVLQLNAALDAGAESRGWDFLDPWTAVAVAGRYVGGASTDGIHPVQDVADQVGRQIGAAALVAAGAD